MLDQQQYLSTISGVWTPSIQTYPGCHDLTMFNMQLVAWTFHHWAETAEYVLDPSPFRRAAAWKIFPRVFIVYHTEQFFTYDVLWRISSFIISFLNINHHKSIAHISIIILTYIHWYFLWNQVAESNDTDEGWRALSSVPWVSSWFHLKDVLLAVHNLHWLMHWNLLSQSFTHLYWFVCLFIHLCNGIYPYISLEFTPLWAWMLDGLKRIKHRYFCLQMLFLGL